MQTIDRSRPVARKAHRCSMCYRTIEPGEKYSRSFNVDSGDAWTWKECEHCEAMVCILWKHFEWYAFDEGYNADAMGEFEPTTNRRSPPSGVLAPRLAPARRVTVPGAHRAVRGLT
ncbi:hypothetical protein [Mycolicibacterium fortuitum]